MSIKFTVFDVETPDYFHSRVCSIGITRIEDWQITSNENYLINPECDFAQRNVNIHGITKDMVADKPIFPDFWEKYMDLFYDSIVVAHRINFDLSVLSKTLKAYRIQSDSIKYIDLSDVVKDVYPDLCDLKLTTICDSLGIDLCHHDSGSDSLAEAKILLDMFDRGLKDNFWKYLKQFDFSESSDACKEEFSPRDYVHVSPETKALQLLKQRIEHITSYGSISYYDFLKLLEYIENNCMGLYGRYPFNDIINKINNIIEDGIVTEKELDDFTLFCQEAFNPVESSDNKWDGIITGKNIVLTGDFECASRSDVEELLKQQGAIIQNGVNKKTNMVIVGKLGSKAWTMGSYGSKVEKAKLLQEQGANILILKEEDIFEL